MSIPPRCLACENNARLTSLPPRERIAADRYWRAAHAFGTSLPGWLILLPLRHVTSIADLTDAEAAVLGQWQVRLSQALHAVTGCTKTYIAQFAEAEGFAHVHFHIIPRMDDLPDEHLGPNVFTMLKRPDELSPAQRDEIAGQIRQHLKPPEPVPTP